MLLLVCFCHCLVGQKKVKGSDVQRCTALLVWHYLHSLGRLWKGACMPSLALLLGWAECSNMIC